MTAAADLATAYETDGFFIIRQLYTAGEVKTWCDELQALIDDAGGNPSGVTVWMPPKFPDFFRQQLLDPRLTDLVKAAIGPHIEFLSAKPVVKSPHIRFASPWHQDYAYWKGTANKLSVWIALDTVTPENGCLRVVKGGHRSFVEHRGAPDGVGFENRLAEDQLPAGEIVDCVMEPGDAIFFHDLLPHCSYPNDAGKRRWCMIPTYRTTDTPDDSTTWAHPIPIA